MVTKVVRKMTKLGVLEKLKEGMNVHQIAAYFGANSNAVYFHIRNLRRQNLWTEPTPGASPGGFTLEAFVDALFQRMEKAMANEAELEASRAEAYRLRQQLAATQNENAVLKDELKGKPQAEERMRQIAKSIYQETVSLSKEAASGLSR